jgi:hypothetical protein
MNPPLQPPSPTATDRRSKQVALVLLGTMGVVGGVVIWDAWRRAQPDAPSPTELPEAPSPPIASDRTYQNNEFTPGVGYYHAPYHAWFPFPFNHHDPSRGYFAGGLWQAAPLAAGLLSSRPSAPAVTSALAAQQLHAQAQRAPGAATSNLTPQRRTNSPASSSFSSRPSPPPAARPSSPPSSSPSRPTIQRGGFGSSGKGASGSGS